MLPYSFLVGSDASARTTAGPYRVTYADTLYFFPPMVWVPKSLPGVVPDSDFGRFGRHAERLPIVSYSCPQYASITSLYDFAPLQISSNYNSIVEVA